MQDESEKKKSQTMLYHIKNQFFNQKDENIFRNSSKKFEKNLKEKPMMKNFPEIQIFFKPINFPIHHVLLDF